MLPHSPRRVGNRTGPGPATVAFVIVVAAVGAVTRAFGVDAGLIALVLATVALVLGPYVYDGIDRRTLGPGDPDLDDPHLDDPDGGAPDGGAPDDRGGS